MHERVLFKAKLISQRTVLEGKKVTKGRDGEGSRLDGQAAAGQCLRARQKATCLR